MIPINYTIANQLLSGDQAYQIAENGLLRLTKVTDGLRGRLNGVTDNRQASTLELS